MGPRLSVMAFDLAGRTGVAFGRVGEKPRSGSIDMGKELPEGQRLAAVVRATRSLLTKHRPDIVVYELAVGGPETSHFLVACNGCLVGTATDLGFEPRSVAVSTIRKHFLGRALTTRDFPGMSKARAKEAIKAAVLKRCGALGWDPKTHDEADAMALWDYAGATWGRGQASPLGGLFDRGAA